jgi:predicted alpha/beta superfamily hydrolase
MRRLAVILALIFAQPLLAQQPKPSSGRIIRFDSFPSRYVQVRNIDVWLPEHYSAEKKYAVLYMHDGQMLFDSTTTWNKQEWGVDETLTELMRKKQIRECIVVGIWNNGKKRFAEYFPQKALQWIPAKDKRTLLSNFDTAYANQYLHFLVTELKPFIDSTFSTYHDQRNTFIAGSSMGGLISMYAISEYPAVFYGAACLSTHWPGTHTANDVVPNAFRQYLLSYLPSPTNHKIYFDYGTATLDSLYRPYQLIVDRVMRNKGFTQRNWITREFTGANHTENAWRKRLHIPFLFLLRK